MKTILCFENEERPVLYNTLVLGKIRTLYPESYIVMLSAGDFSCDGVLLTPSGKERSAHYIMADADIVLSLPTASVLGGYGKKEFAEAALVQRLHASDQVVLPCTPLPGQTAEACGKQLRALAMLMFRDPADYRSRLSENLNRCHSFREAQTQALCCCMPEAQPLLSRPENRHALWMLDAMLQLYYMAEVDFMEAPEWTDSPGTNEDPKQKEHFEQKSALKIKTLLETASYDTLIDISGSTDHMVQTLLEQKSRLQEAASLEQMITLLAPEPMHRIRLFLLKALLGIRKIYMQICSLHVFVPYCYVAAVNPQKVEEFQALKKASWVPFADEEAQLQKLKESYAYLLQSDQKAQEFINS